MTRTHAYIAVLLTTLATAYGQIVIKWQVNQLNGFLASDWLKKITILLGLFLNPWIISSLGAAVIASVLWMAAMARLDLSEAYPMTSLNLVLVSVSGMVFFHETMTMNKIFGVGCVIIGLLILGKQ